MTGEVDIIEGVSCVSVACSSSLPVVVGVNDVNPNLMSLHTSAGCVQRYTSGEMKGEAVSTETLFSFKPDGDMYLILEHKRQGLPVASPVSGNFNLLMD